MGSNKNDTIVNMNAEINELGKTNFLRHLRSNNLGYLKHKNKVDKP